MTEMQETESERGGQWKLGGDGSKFGGLRKLLEVWRGCTKKLDLKSGVYKNKIDGDTGGSTKKSYDTIDS